MGKLHKLRRAVEKDPEVWYFVRRSSEYPRVKARPGLDLNKLDSVWRYGKIIVEHANGAESLVWKEGRVWHHTRYIRPANVRKAYGARYNSRTRSWLPDRFSKSYRNFVRKTIESQ